MNLNDLKNMFLVAAKSTGNTHDSKHQASKKNFKHVVNPVWMPKKAKFSPAMYRRMSKLSKIGM